MRFEFVADKRIKVKTLLKVMMSLKDYWLKSNIRAVIY